MLATTETTLTEQEQEVIRVYDELVRSESLSDTRIWVDRFTFDAYRTLPIPNSVIDVGCGYGRFIPLLNDLEIQLDGYVGIDPSVEQLALARARYPELESQFREGSIYMLADMYPEKFDGFVLIAVLMHIPRHRLLEALRSLRGCLKKGAVGLFSTPGGTGEALNRQKVFITLYTLDELTATFQQAGFHVTDAYSPDGCMILGSICAT